MHTDHLNTPRKVSRPSDNKVRWRWNPPPFGNTAPNQNPESLGTFVYNLRYPGQYFQSETGLFYNYFRDYDPQVGRYIESDPIGLTTGPNTYVYADSDPVSLIDPYGLKSRSLNRQLRAGERIPISQLNQIVKQPYNSPYTSRLPERNPASPQDIIQQLRQQLRLYENAIGTINDLLQHSRDIRTDIEYYRLREEAIRNADAVRADLACRKPN